MSGGNAALSRQEALRRWNCYLSNNRQSGKTAVALGIPTGTFSSWVSSFRATHGFNGPPDEWFTIEHPDPAIIPAPLAKPIVRVRAVTTESPPDGPIRRVVAIGDLHQKPGRSPERFKWIGRYVADQRPDNVVCIGDAVSLDSLSTHDKPGSRGFYERGSFAEDMEDLEGALHLYHNEVGIGHIPHDITYGNHEFRAWRAEENSPNLRDTIVLPIEQNFARYQWKTHPYGAWLFLDSVAFTHIPFNAIGRDFRGESVENQIGPRAVFSMCIGHTHKECHRTFPKIGPQKRIEICNLGTAMPYGEVEQYAGLSMTGWTWGIKELTLQGGHIVGHHFISMLELERNFS